MNCTRSGECGAEGMECTVCSENPSNARRFGTVYLSGPISGVIDYRERFRAAEMEVERHHAGDIINPADQGSAPDWEWADWMIYDLALLRKAKVLVQLPGCSASRGAKIEDSFARGMGIPVVRLEDFEEWVNA